MNNNHAKEDFYEKITQHLSSVGSDVKGLRIDFNEHVKRDCEWKRNAQPALDAWSNIKGFGKVGAIIAGFVIGAGAVVGVIYSFFIWIIDAKK